MKTPEELAEDFAFRVFGGSYEEMEQEEKGRWGDAYHAFLAGYQAAKEHAHAALEEAEAKIQELEDQVADGSKVMNEFDAMLEEKELVDIKLRDAFYRSFNFLICNESVPVFRLNDIRSYVGHLEDVLMARNSPEKPHGSNSSNNSNGWISVKDRLPEIDGEMVLASDGSRRVTANFFHVGQRFHFYNPHMEHVTHWMPLPEAPKEEA